MVVVSALSRTPARNLREGDFVDTFAGKQEVIVVDKEPDSVMVLLANERIVRFRPEEMVVVNTAIYKAIRGKRGSG